MFCKNCGQEISDVADFCTNCGAAKGSGTSFCANCGTPIAPEAVVCTNCGCATAPAQNNAAPQNNGAPQGSNFCTHCGAQLMPGAAVCTQCGCATAAMPTKGNKSKMLAGLLAIFVGYLGIHNFYLGYTKRGVIQLLISVLLSWTVAAPIAIWVWTIVEAVKIFQGETTDAQGNALSD